MRELHHYIIKSSNQISGKLLPVYIHCNDKLDRGILDTIGKYIEVNLEFIETNARLETSLLSFREGLQSPPAFLQDPGDNFSIHFTTKNRTKFYSTIKFDAVIAQDTAHLTTTSLHLCSFELYLFITYK